MLEKEDQPADIRHYRNVAKKIVQRHFGKPASRIVYKSSGRTNFVFAVNHVEGQFVVRVSPDADRIKAFQKELRASQKAREAGVPTPEVLAVGTDSASEPYMITRRVTGIEASQNPKRLHIVQEMGEYAAIINSIGTDGFGADFEWGETGNKNGNWDTYLQNEFELTKRIEILSDNQILSAAKLKELERIVTGAHTKQLKTTLNHSDLRLKNVIVDEGGDIAAILDWEDCLSTFAPEWDVSIALHDLTIDEKHAFIDGYGLTVQQVEEMAPLIKAFNILNYARAVESAIQTEDQKNLDHIKLRLAGRLDLYSL
jgi:aminoglycoside phosphotransferase (APT) family kinase protein